MKVVALVRTHDFNDFLVPMVEAVQDHVDAMVFVNSTTTWTGEKIENRTKQILFDAFDSTSKFYHIKDAFNAQIIQNQTGYDFIRLNFDADWVMVVDTDEIWEKRHLDQAFNYLEDSFDFNNMSVGMRTYIKSVDYQIYPAEFCKPCAFFRPISRLMMGCRGEALSPRLTVPNIYFHHYTYVRKDENALMKKIANSINGDKELIPHAEFYDIKEWKETRYDRLPDVENFHIHKGWEHSWKKIKVISEDEVPDVIKKFHLNTRTIK